MKKILFFIFLLISIKGFSQYPNGKQTLGSDSNVIEPKGGLHGRLINWRYADTSLANFERISQYPGAQISVGNLIYVRDQTATHWIAQAPNNISNITISGDTIFICNFNSCDTIISPIQVGLVTILNDSTLQVCPPDFVDFSECDTLNIPRTQFINTLFDTTTIYQTITNQQIYFDSLLNTKMDLQVLTDTSYVIREGDSLRIECHLYTDFTLVCDTDRIVTPTNIRNFLDTIPDSLFVRSQVFNGTDTVMKIRHGPRTGIDTLVTDIPVSDPTHDGYMPKEAWAYIDSVGGAGGGGISGIDNIGTGFNWVQASKINVKRAGAGNGILIDSTTTANTNTFKADTSILATINYVTNHSGSGGVDSIRKKGVFMDSVTQYSGGTGTFDFRIPQYFNVKDYGAIADGSTDNTTAFQNAINAAVAAGGGTIYIPYANNTYIISGALQTSVSSVNPNCQLYFPLAPYSNKPVNVKILGGTMPNFLGLTRQKQGVIIESTIQGTGNFPSVIGSPYALYGPTGLGYRNYMHLILENVIIRTSTVSGGVDVAGTMTAVNGARFLGVMTRNVKLDVSSQPANIVEPTNETYGIIFPTVNNAAELQSEGILFAEGYKYGLALQEHFTGDYLLAVNCANGIVVDTGYHSINIQSYSSEANTVGILMKGRTNVNIEQMDVEHFTSTWRAAAYDVKFETPSTSVVSGAPYAYSGTLGFLATRSVHINFFNHAAPEIGSNISFLTNDSTNVFLEAINNVDLTETIQYPSSTATQNINLLNGSKSYITLTANTAVNLSNSFFGKEVTIFAKQDATGSRTLTVMGTAVTIDLTPAAVTKVVGINTTSGWVFATENTNGSVVTSGWQLNGNAIVAGTDFLGTTNNTSLRFKTNNTPVAVLDSNGRFGIGTAAPVYDLHVKKGVGSAGTVSSTVENTNAAGEALVQLRTTTGTLSSELFGSSFANGNKTLISTSSAITDFGIATFGSNSISLRTNTTTGFDNTRLFISGTGAIGIGNTSPGSFFHITNTTEQLRLAYDVSNYLSATVASTGATTFGITGSSPILTTPAQTTIGSNFVFNSTNKVLALGGTTASTWASQTGVIEGGGGSLWFTSGSGGDLWATGNGFFDGAWKYKATGVASNIGITGGQVWLRAAASGSANGAITWVLPLMADKAGVKIGDGSTPTALLHIKAGTATASTAPLKFTSGTNLTTPEAGAVEFNGTDLQLTTGARYVLAKTLQASATLDFASTAVGAVADLTVTVTGAALNDEVSVGVPNGSVTATGTFFGWVSATNTVTVRFVPHTGTEDPASGTFRVSVIKH